MTNNDKIRREFSILIDRCGCSRAHLSFTQSEADDYNETMEYTKKDLLYLKPYPPSCTPYRCFPELMKLLYPKGGFRKKSNMYHNSLVNYERRVKEEL